MFSLCFSEAQPVYIGVPASHRRKRRRHHSCASDADRAARHTHYEHHSHREHSHRGYYHEREEHYDEDEGSTGHQEHTDPSGRHLLVFLRWNQFERCKLHQINLASSNMKFQQGAWRPFLRLLAREFN